MNNAFDPIDSRISAVFINEAQTAEKGFTKFVKKACGYPRHRAWQDRLDMSHFTFFEDYARQHSLSITHYSIDKNGDYHVVFEKKPKTNWMGF